MGVAARRVTRKRVPRGRRKRTVIRYVEEADRVQRSRLGVKSAG
jgi:hypothetical protein